MLGALYKTKHERRNNLIIESSIKAERFYNKLVYLYKSSDYSEDMDKIIAYVYEEYWNTMNYLNSENIGGVLINGVFRPTTKDNWMVAVIGAYMHIIRDSRKPIKKFTNQELQSIILEMKYKLEMHYAERMSHQVNIGYVRYLENSIQELSNKMNKVA